MAKKQVNIRASDATRAKLDWLASRYGTKAEVVAVAIDRMHRDIASVDAYRMMKEAIRVGALPPPRTHLCQECHREQATRYHHEDYEYPLVVMPLCNLCHAKVHPEIYTFERAPFIVTPKRSLRLNAIIKNASIDGDLLDVLDFCIGYTLASIDPRAKGRG